MGSIYQKILSDLKQAMKDRDAGRLLVLRSLKSKILEKEISIRGSKSPELTDQMISEVLLKALKQRRDSFEQYQNAGRDDLANSEKYEMDIVADYLPKMLSEEEIRDLALEVISSSGAASPSDAGKVTGILMSRVKGRADGSMVNKIVRDLLEKK